MSREISYTYARDNLARVLDEAESTREAVVIRRRGHPDVAVISGEELRSLEETAHLLRSPENVRRLLEALDQVRGGGGSRLTIEELQKSVGL